MPITVVLSTGCLFLLLNFNLFADKAPDPVKGICQICNPPQTGTFMFTYDKDGNEITIFGPDKPGGTIVIRPGHDVFITGNDDDDIDFEAYFSPLDFNLSLRVEAQTLAIKVEEDVEVDIIDIYEFRTVVSSFVRAGDYQMIEMPTGIRTDRPYGIIAKKDGRIVQTAVFYFNAY